jgi:hypothetical protein
MKMTNLEKPIENVDEYNTRMVKLNDHIQKALKAKGAIYNALILKGMNDLIAKHYVMGFQKKICQQVQYKQVDICKEAQTIEKRNKKSLQGHNFETLQNKAPMPIPMMLMLKTLKSPQQIRINDGANHQINESIKCEFGPSKRIVSFQI